MQTPEGQALLKLFGHLTERTPKLDPLLPWLAREVKKNRIDHMNGTPEEVLDPNTPMIGHLRMRVPHPINKGEFTGHPLSPVLPHLADWYADKRAPNRQGLDIMQHTAPEIFNEKIPEYDKWLEDRQAAANAKDAESTPIAHQYPDGWTLRKLRGKDCQYEGDAMGHCVGSYGNEVDQGNTMIYSLRDPNQVPHATMELEPNHYEFDGLDQFPVPQESRIVQIQGKGNGIPKPEYQARLKQWFETMAPEERPYWEGEPIRTGEELMSSQRANEPGEAEGFYENGDYDSGMQAHGDYGVENKSEVEWPEVLKNSTPNDPRAYIEADPDDIYLAALKRKEIPQLANALEEYGNDQRDNYDEWRMMNNHITVPYPDETEQYPLELPNGEIAETPEEHERIYNEDEAAWEAEHPGTNITNQLYQYLSPHYNGSDYDNPIRPDPSAYVRGQSSANLWAGWGHPAQRLWEAGQVPEIPPEGVRMAEFMDKTPNSCPTCGDPLEHGKCKRCDWGKAGPNKALWVDDSIPDPTKEVRPAIQK